VCGPGVRRLAVGGMDIKSEKIILKIGTDT